ncbi:hypothetical protein GCM10022419_002430 [Nonomuraea rosea]|uniref:SnoaL-like domain-containing protein n=1 Tax=Nonomuraea rosea TaxID=638574 RepID=A0ABP6V545_9ACTN
MKATLSGDVAALERLLADDAVAWADGGGTTAARRPVRGRATVARYLRGLSGRPQAAGAAIELLEVNGEPAALIRDAEVFGVGDAAAPDNAARPVRNVVPDAAGRRADRPRLRRLQEGHHPGHRVGDAPPGSVSSRRQIISAVMAQRSWSRQAPSMSWKAGE